MILLCANWARSIRAKIIVSSWRIREERMELRERTSAVFFFGFGDWYWGGGMFVAEDFRASEVL